MSPKNITVYDPAMCCSTGVCGPEVGPKLARFSADLNWLATQGATVRRFNLAQEPGALAEDAEGALERKGEAALPFIKAGDGVVSGRAYPSRDELAAWAGLASPSRSVTPSGCSSCRGHLTSPPGAAALRRLLTLNRPPARLGAPSGARDS